MSSFEGLGYSGESTGPRNARVAWNLSVVPSSDLNLLSTLELSRLKELLRYRLRKLSTSSVVTSISLVISE